MICLICRQAEVIDDLTSLSFQRGEMHLVIDRVPARVCPSCGEAYLDEEVAAQLLQSAEEMYQTGVLEGHSEYNAAQI